MVFPFNLGFFLSPWLHRRGLEIYRSCLIKNSPQPENSKVGFPVITKARGSLMPILLTYGDLQNKLCKPKLSMNIGWKYFSHRIQFNVVFKIQDYIKLLVFYCLFQKTTTTWWLVCYEFTKHRACPHLTFWLHADVCICLRNHMSQIPCFCQEHANALK